MYSTGLFLWFLMGSIIYSLYTYSCAKHKTKDATQTAIFIVLYPFFTYVMINNKPIETWLAVPAAMVVVPWLFAGIHLNQVVKDPSITDSKDFAGFPKKLWFQLGIASVLIGAAFG